MYDIVFFLSQNEIYFYLILGGISIFLISKLFNAISHWRDAAFGLEREIAQRKFGTSLTLLNLNICIGHLRIFFGFILFKFYAGSCRYRHANDGFVS